MTDRPKSERRKSLSVFSPSAASFFTPSANDRPSNDDAQLAKKRVRRNSGFFGRSANPVATPGTQPHSHGTTEPETTQVISVTQSQAPEHPRPRRKSLQKKRNSVLGSFRSLRSFEDDEKSAGHSKGSSGADEEEDTVEPRNAVGSMVLHHGEIQATGGMWRRKSQYLVLTDTHLVRFKNQSKAADMFPSIPPSFARPSGNRQSFSSTQDAQLPFSTDPSTGIPLNSIISAYMLNEGKPSSSVEVAYVDERTRKAAFIQMQTPDSQELNLWMMGVRSGAGLARSADPLPYDRRSLEHVIRVLEYERDYDPEVFHMFRVLQMASNSLSDDIVKLSPVGCYLAVGCHKVHLVPMQKIASRSPVIPLTDLEMASSFGLMNLTCLSMELGEDTLHLTFRVPLRKACSIFLASVHSTEIAVWLRKRTEFLRPLWTSLPYEFIAPSKLHDVNDFAPVGIDEDYGCLDRTLVAYSASYGIDTSNIRYTIDMQCDDAPCFRLLRPAYRKRQRYTALELIAVMRALRYNEAFRSVSFSGVSLDAIQEIRDLGPDIDAHRNRAGARVHIPGQEHLSVLAQEVRALALKSRSLRRMDFSYSLSRIPTLDSGAHGTGCGIPEAIFPACRRKLTSVDWVVLNGIKLDDSDLDYLVDAASQRSSHMRALEVGNCGLSVHDVDLLLSTVVAQGNTIESINISGVQGRLSPSILLRYIGYLGHIKKLDLSRISRTSGAESLITPEILLNWKLEELSLSQTTINSATADSIATYLASDWSKGLRVLRLDQCGLSGEDVAVLLRSMSMNGPRNLHLHVSENRIDQSCSYLFQAISQNDAPSHMSMRMIDFKKEEHFRELIEALRKNRTLKYLDISKASLPYDASPETCKSLQLMFEENETLEDLNISGESAHLDVTRFGIGLNMALTGLKRNKSLKVLRIEHQKLGLQGASTLASVLEENSCLREVYCEHNDINLQSFTVLVNGMQRNKNLLSISSMKEDKIMSLKRVRKELEAGDRESASAQPPSTVSIRRSLHAAVGGHVTGHKLAKSSQYGLPPVNANTSGPTEYSQVTSHDVNTVLEVLSRKWEAETARLQRYLVRNYRLAQGIYNTASDASSDGRPTTAKSLDTMLDSLTFEASRSRAADASALPPPSTDDRASGPVEEGIPGGSQVDNLDIFRSLDVKLSLDDETTCSQKTPAFLSRPLDALPEASPSCQQPAAPVSIVPTPADIRTDSALNRRGASTRSASTVMGTNTQGSYGMTPPALRRFLSSDVPRANRRTTYVSSDGPPVLDWSLPKLDF